MIILHNQVKFKEKQAYGNSSQNIVIDGDNDMQFMGLMQKHITRKPATTSKTLE